MVMAYVVMVYIGMAGGYVICSPDTYIVMAYVGIAYIVVARGYRICSQDTQAASPRPLHFLAHVIYYGV